MPPPSYPPTLNGVPLPPLPISDNDERVAAVAGISASAIEEKTEVEAGKAESKSSEPPQLPTPRPVPPNEAAMKLIKKAKKLISGGSIEPAKRLLKKSIKAHPTPEAEEMLQTLESKKTAAATSALPPAAKTRMTRRSFSSPESSRDQEERPSIRNTLAAVRERPLSSRVQNSPSAALPETLKDLLPHIPPPPGLDISRASRTKYFTKLKCSINAQGNKKGKEG